MSTTKFSAAKEFIQEKKYDEARSILKTMDHPTATKWLAKLDEIDPPFPVNITPRAPSHSASPAHTVDQTTSPPLTTEQERFYRRENANARFKRTVSGLELIGIAIVCFVVFAFFAATAPTSVENGVTRTDLGFSWLFILLGVIALAGGMRKLSKPSST